MRLRKNFRLYIESAARHGNQLEFVDAFSDLAMLVFYPILACHGAWYLTAIVIATDILRFILRGAWYHAPFHETAHWHNPSKDFNAIWVSCCKIVLLIVLAIMKLFEICLIDVISPRVEHIRAWIWYAIVVTAIVETFRCLLHTLHKFNSDWLCGTSGRIGLPNWVSIGRMAISIIMPHIYICHSFGEYSSIIATILLIIAIGTDAIDGYIARHTNSITKVGKYLDPLSDKVIFFPNAVAFAWLIYRDHTMIGGRGLLYGTIILMLVAVSRDLLFITWFFVKGSKIPSGIGASTVDKIRMGGICAWLLAIGIALTMPYASATRSYMTVLSLILLAIVAVLSVVSIRIDSERLKTFES
ncbi:CDP-alcohol phosphatidyltransferase family protein [Candidatus Saccharibacteria bacterium]|nr:CDP-alcohol phosphatidyltransferase family protein [Candidatus Saccharibacteria bacterium]